jgi:flagellum-specific ATP synthase
VEGDDLNEPISDAVRGILDGHVALSRRFADRSLYPAVDPLRSVSRVMNDIVDARHRAAAMMIRSRLAAYEDIEDLINLGAYREGANPEVDHAVRLKPEIDKFLKQETTKGFEFSQIRDLLVELAGTQGGEES